MSFHTPQHTPQQPEPLHEMAHRFDGELDVTLFWDRSQRCALLCISDTSTGAYLIFPIDEEHALDAFRHPSRYLPTIADWQWCARDSGTTSTAATEGSES